MPRLNETRIVARTPGAVLADTLAASASTSLALATHARHACVVYVGLDADVAVTGPSGTETRARAVAVGPHRSHRVSCEGPAVGFQYDPLRAPEALVTLGTAGSGVRPLEARVVARLAAALATHAHALHEPDVLAGIAAEAMGWLVGSGAGGGAATVRRMDRRVVRLTEALRDPDVDRVALLDGAIAGASPSHLRDLFARDVGIPMRAFQLWHRLLRGLVTFSQRGATTAAHAVGFADLAHFSRTSRRMLGASPKALSRNLIAR